MKVNAKQLLDLLTKKESIIGSKGKITFTLNELSTEIDDKNIIGNILQDWLEAWLSHNSIEFGFAASTQEFPDFYLDPENKISDLLELKAFDMTASANFDIANFESYSSSLLTKPYRLNADYLIFGYRIINKEIIIENLWLKKIWEITGPSAAYPLRIQQKRGMIYNIRPINWYTNGKSTFKPFTNKDEFLDALHRTLLKYEKTAEASISWLDQVRVGIKNLAE